MPQQSQCQSHGGKKGTCTPPISDIGPSTGWPSHLTDWLADSRVNDLQVADSGSGESRTEYSERTIMNQLFIANNHLHSAAQSL